VREKARRDVGRGRAALLTIPWVKEGDTEKHDGPGGCEGGKTPFHVSKKKDHGQFMENSAERKREDGEKSRRYILIEKKERGSGSPILGEGNLQ